MKNIKKITGLVLTGALIAGTAAGCGKSSEGDSDNTVVTLGVVGVVYEDVWAPAKEKLAKEGIDLQFKQFSDYTTPNNALNNGEIDLNAFQHQIYLDSEIESYGYEIETIGYTFIVPLNLFSSKIDSVDEIKAGDSVAIPNDATNGGRALKVLEAAGLIKLSDDAPDSPTLKDVEEYLVDIKIVELAANTIPSALADVAAGIVNESYAVDFGLTEEDVIYNDTSVSDKIYWNLVAAKSEDLEDEETKELYKKVIAAFQTDETEELFNTEYNGLYIKAGWDVNLLGD